MYEDKTLVCKECGKEFIHSARDQAFYHEKGFENEPKKCPECRRASKNARTELFTTTCAACGQEATVKFKPSNDRPVYCSECFAKMKEQQL